MMTSFDEAEWEEMWSAYDEGTYARALEYVPAGSSVLDIGAGDLRLARRMAERARVVYAIEQRLDLLNGPPLPENLIAIGGDARVLPFPRGIDTAVLLMRHCRHFALYREKLAAVGCARLITNARWRMGVECIDLTAAPQHYDDLELGWYACRCGATGFRSGPPDRLSALLADTIFEIDCCPECDHHGWTSNRFP